MPPELDGHVPSGAQYGIACGDQRATIVEVGGGIREYFAGERAVLEPYPIEAICDGAHGAMLVPWPNRLADGQYSFDGVDYQVALTEPKKRNAIHGFLRWRSWQAAEHESDRVTMTAAIHPFPGYPFALEASVTYRLAADGLTVTTSATNAGPGPCPFACGQHPYLAPGEGLIDDCVLEAPGRTRILTDPERQLPTGSEGVDGTSFDFRRGRLLGDQAMDSPFTDLARDGEGRAWVRLRGSDDRRAELWVDEGYPIVELYTGDTLSSARRRRGLGCEPMTAPPNAFQTGEGLLRLETGQTATMSWGARLS